MTLHPKKSARGWDYTSKGLQIEWSTQQRDFTSNGLHGEGTTQRIEVKIFRIFLDLDYTSEGLHIEGTTHQMHLYIEEAPHRSDYVEGTNYETDAV